MYMLRITIPGGGPITAEQWNTIDRVSEIHRRATKRVSFCKAKLKDNNKTKHTTALG